VHLLAEVTLVKSILDFLQPLFKDWGYFIVFGLALLEHSFMVGLAVPGDAVILLGALYAGFGDLNIVVVILLAFVGSVLGDNIGYLLGSRIGRPLIDRHGDFMRLRARVKYVEKYFKKYGGATGSGDVPDEVEDVHQVGGRRLRGVGDRIRPHRVLLRKERGAHTPRIQLHR